VKVFLQVVFCCPVIEVMDRFLSTSYLLITKDRSLTYVYILLTYVRVMV
jgi:hypothetical protein